MISIAEFTGRLHPALVHLPIGILLLGGVFLALARTKKYSWTDRAVDVTLQIGAVCAILSCITGYILSQNGDYQGELVSKHQWLGISVAAVSVLVCYVRIKKISPKLQW